MKEKSKSIEERFKSMSERDHILNRPGMWVGSIKYEESQQFIYDVDEAKMKVADVAYIPAMLKLVDEVISNSCDEFRRKGNMGLTKIKVTINSNGYITIRDNGGIPIVKHKVAGVYLPEFLFGQLRSSSNYDDSEERDVVGTNGVGSALTNVWSKQYEITSADGKKQYHRTWSNNMEINDDLKISVTCDHFTETKFLLDYERFDEEDESYITEDFISIIEKRCIDAAAANPGLTTIFEYIENDKTVRKVEWKFKTFEEYIELYSDYIDQENCISFKDKQKQVWVYPDGGLNIGFVNGAECSKGTHIKAIRNEINTAIATQILQKNKLDVGPRNVDNKYTMFCIYHVANPAYDSQLKTCLTTPVERFSMDPDYKFSIPDKFIKECCKSEIVNIVIDWYKQKAEVEDQKTLRKLNKQAKTKIRNSDKFIDANTKVRKDRELWIFEGDSARAGFRSARNPQTQAAYMLRGKILNISGLGPTKIMANQELGDLITIIGLQWGEKNKPDDLNFGKIVICTDADADGHAIAGLLINFLNLFPELYDNGMVCRSISPIITAEKGNDLKKFYSLSDYKKEESKLKGYKITYLKGLGTQTNKLYKDMMQNPIFHYFTKDDISDLSLRSWFGKGNASERKSMLKNDVE